MKQLNIIKEILALIKCYFGFHNWHMPYEPVSEFCWHCLLERKTND